MFTLTEMPLKKFIFYRILIGASLALFFIHFLISYNNLFLDNKTFFPWIILGLICSISFLMGFFRRIMAIILLIILGSITFYSENILRVVPGYLGFYLIFTLFIPKEDKTSWKIPVHLFNVYIFVLIFSILNSGVIKLLNPFWISGEALIVLQSNPRMGSFLLNLNLSKSILTLFNYLVISLELICPILYLFKKTRLLGFLSIMFLFLFMLFLMNIPLLTGTMLIMLSMSEDGYIKKWYA